MGGLMGSYSLHAESQPHQTANDRFNVSNASRSGIGPLMIGIIGAVVVLVTLIWVRS